jgi:hypothetical protein
MQLPQHFRGWFVRTPTDRFDPAVTDLTNFRVTPLRRRSEESRSARHR